MMLLKEELLDVFEAAYDLDVKIKSLMETKKEVNKEKNSLLESYAKSNEISPKTLSQGYGDFKAYKEKKVDANDEDYFSILSIIEEHFRDEDDESEDSLSC